MIRLMRSNCRACGGKMLQVTWRGRDFKWCSGCGKKPVRPGKRKKGEAR